jgi:uncharacterized membrane protein
MSATTTAQLFRLMALTGFLGLLTVLLLWNAWLSPPTQYPVALVLIILLTPLLFPLRGILHGRRYTHAWVSMLTLFYFCIGVTEAYGDPAARYYGLAVTACSLLLFVGAIGYVKLTAAPKNPAPHL